MSLGLLMSAAGTVALALWLVGVTGRLGTTPTENWILFAAGIGLVAVSGAGAVLPRRD